MQTYISNILPRIVSFSESLDKKETFIEKPWVLIDEKGNKTQYIFNRDGRLLISVNGIGHEGTWEYIKGANTLWLKIEEKKYMLKQGFIDPAVMILKLDGPGNDLWTFGNENILKDIAVDKYIQKLVYQKDAIATVELKDGNVLEVVNRLNNSNIIGLPVKINNEQISSGIYLSKKGNQYKIKDGRINEILYRKTYTVENKPIEFYCQNNYELSKGDKLIINEVFSPGKWYKVKETNNRIKINDGKIARIKNMYLIYIILFLGLAILLFAILIYANS